MWIAIICSSNTCGLKIQYLMLQRNNAFSSHSLIYLWQLKSCLKSQVYFRSILLDIADTALEWKEGYNHCCHRMPQTNSLFHSFSCTGDATRSIQALAAPLFYYFYSSLSLTLTLSRIFCYLFCCCLFRHASGSEAVPIEKNNLI